MRSLPALQHRAAVELGMPYVLSPHWEILTGFLCFLYCLHVYWCAAAARPWDPRASRLPQSQDGLPLPS